jgi:hypothetical protein
MTIIKSTDEIYPIITDALKNANQPLTCADLMGMPEVFNAALRRWGQDKVRASEKVSDTLGFMWRRGILDRFPAPPSHSMARYAYAIANQHVDEPVKIKPSSTKNKGDLNVIEKDGEVVIEMKNFIIVVKPK